MRLSLVRHPAQTRTPETIGSRSAKAFLSLSTIAVCTKVLGFAEKLVVAHFFGTDETADVYFGVTGIVLSLIWVVRELAYPSLLPVFAETRGKSRAQSVMLLRRSLLLAAAFLGVLALLLTAGAGPLIRVLVPGFSHLKRQMATRLLRLMAPALFFLGMAMVTYTVLNACRRFALAALPDAALKLLVVVGLIVLVPAVGIDALALVMGVGGLGCFVAHLFFIPARGLLGDAGTTGDSCPAFRKMLLLMGPLVLGVVFSHATGLVGNLLASTLPTGQLSYLGYAKKLTDALLLVGPVALVTVVYSHLSNLASSNQRVEFARLVAKMLRLMIYLTVPVGCILVALREPIVWLLFQRGQFDVVSTMGTARAFMVYSLGLPVFALEALLVHAWFALADTKTPVKLGIVCSLFDIALAVLLLGPLQYLSIACAFLIARTLKVVALGVLLDRKLGGIFGRELLILSAKLTVAGSIMWGILSFLGDWHHEGPFAHVAVRGVIVPALVAVLAFVASSYALKIEEFRAAAVLIRRKAAITTLCVESE